MVQTSQQKQQHDVKTYFVMTKIPCKISILIMMCLVINYFYDKLTDISRSGAKARICQDD